MQNNIHPILVSIPHASSKIPDEVADLVALTPDDVLGYTDLYTDQIFNIDNVPIVEAKFSRVIVDPNRAPDDISKEHKQAAEGVIVHTTWDGKNVYHEEPSEQLVNSLISNYHDPYHKKIDEHMTNVHFLMDCHSFLPVGPKLKADSGEPRPDINLGNVNYSSCSREHTIFFRDFFEKNGYSVSINFPYIGKYILGHHCHRRRIPPFLVPGIQIELNQGLYVKEDSLQPIPERIDEFHVIFKKLVGEFSKRFCV
jgi:N-formylglutamate deformylase